MRQSASFHDYRHGFDRVDDEGQCRDCAGTGCIVVGCEGVFPDVQKPKHPTRDSNWQRIQGNAKTM